MRCRVAAHSPNTRMVAGRVRENAWLACSRIFSMPVRIIGYGYFTGTPCPHTPVFYCVATHANNLKYTFWAWFFSVRSQSVYRSNQQCNNSIRKKWNLTRATKQGSRVQPWIFEVASIRLSEVSRESLSIVLISSIRFSKSGKTSLG